MFGFLLGTARTDLEVAKIINVYLGTYHRTYTNMGLDFMLGTIKANPLVTDFHDHGDTKQFRIQRELADFLFILSTFPIPNTVPMVMAKGTETFKGFTIHFDLAKGSLMVDLKRSPNASPRAINLAKLFGSKFGALRMP